MSVYNQDPLAIRKSRKPKRKPVVPTAVPTAVPGPSQPRYNINIFEFHNYAANPYTELPKRNGKMDDEDDEEEEDDDDEEEEEIEEVTLLSDVEIKTEPIEEETEKRIEFMDVEQEEINHVDEILETPPMKIEEVIVPSNYRIPDETYSRRLNELEWTKKGRVKRLPSSGRPVLLTQLPNETPEPIDYFLLIMDDEILEEIVKQTNNFVVKISRSKKKIKRVDPEVRKNWTLLTVPELKIYLALVLHMGTIKIAKLEDYWKKDEILTIPVFPRYMSKTRFYAITNYVRYGFDTNGITSHIQYENTFPIMELFNRKMASIYYPGKDLMIVESPLTGLPVDQNKFSKSSMRLQFLMEPNGVIQKCVLWTRDILGAQALNFVFKLLEEHLDKGHSVFLNEKYTGFYLCKALMDRKTFSTGPVRRSVQKVPLILLNHQVQNNGHVVVYSNDVCFGKFKDTTGNESYYISTETTSDMCRRTLDAQAKNMQHQENMLTYHPCERYKLRLHKKLGTHLLQIVLMNSYHLFKTFDRREMDFHGFRLLVIYKLLDQGRIEQSTTVERPLEMSGNHYPSKYIKNGKQKRKRCQFCSIEKIRKATPYYCAACPNQPGLCLEPCFAGHHEDNHMEYILLNKTG